MLRKSFFKELIKIKLVKILFVIFFKYQVVKKSVLEVKINHKTMELFRATQNLPKLQSEWNLGLQKTVYGHLLINKNVWFIIRDRSVKYFFRAHF